GGGPGAGPWSGPPLSSPGGGPGGGPPSSPARGGPLKSPGGGPCSGPFPCPSFPCAPGDPPLRAKAGRPGCGPMISSIVNCPSPFLSSVFNAAEALAISSASIIPSPLASSALTMSGVGGRSDQGGTLVEQGRVGRYSSAVSWPSPFLSNVFKAAGALAISLPSIIPS